MITSLSPLDFFDCWNAICPRRVNPRTVRFNGSALALKYGPAGRSRSNKFPPTLNFSFTGALMLLIETVKVVLFSEIPGMALASNVAVIEPAMPASVINNPPCVPLTWTYVWLPSPSATWKAERPTLMMLVPPWVVPFSKLKLPSILTNPARSACKPVTFTPTNGAAAVPSGAVSVPLKSLTVSVRWVVA